MVHHLLMSSAIAAEKIGAREQRMESECYLQARRDWVQLGGSLYIARGMTLLKTSASRRNAEDPPPDEKDPIQGLASNIPRIAMRFSATAQLVQQRPGVLQVSGAEALGEPVVDVGEHSARFVTAAGVAQQPREAGCRAQLP